MRSHGTSRKRLVALVVAALMIPLSQPGLALPGPLADGPFAPGPLPNGTLPNGTRPNGSLPNISFPNGSLPSFGIPEFSDHTEAAGLGSVTGSRVAWGDFDNDGWDDLMFSGGRLFRNDRTGAFTDVTLAAGTAGPYRGGVWGDYNNDGWLDFYATAWRHDWDTLLRNNGDGTFTNVTVAAGGVFDDLPSEAAAWGDFDNDGCLDLYVVNYEWPPLDDVTDSLGTPNILWHNECDGTFTNATDSAGVFQVRRSRGAIWTDYNHDGWQDLYVSNYRLEPNELWENNRNGTFTNVGPQAGVDCDNRTVTNPSGVCGHSIGADVADFNNDGDLDIFVANLNHPRLVPAGGDFSALYRNGGAPNYGFTNVRALSGIGYCETASNPTWGDYDADGDPDLFVTSIYENRTNNMYRNDGLSRFSEVTDRAQLVSDNGWGAAWSDFDNDGDLDLVVGSSSGVRLWRNPGNDNSWIQLELQGRSSNKAAIGARVTVGTGRDAQVQEIQGGEGTASQSSLRLFYGLGSTQGSVDVFVEWPSGLTQEEQFAVDGIYLVVEPEGSHDLAVNSLTLSPRSPVVNSQIMAKAQLENAGQLPVDSAVVAFYRGTVSPANLLTTASVDRFTGTQNVSVALTAPSSPGPLTVVAALEQQRPSDVDPSNDQRIDAVTVRSNNGPPEAELLASPIAVVVGETVSFDASGSTDDTGIMQYIFAFGDGEVSNGTDSVADHNYTEAGSYIARLTVIDEDGEPSVNDASVAISVVQEGASLPVAVIESVAPPSPSMVGTVVTFEGSGQSEASTIVEYNWSSDIEGLLSHDPIFQEDGLSLGNHHITLRVRDAEGFVSAPASIEYLVVNRGAVAITIRDIVNDSRLTGLVVVRGIAVASAGVVVVAVEWRVDQGNFTPAQGEDEWSFVLATMDFDEGLHDLTVRVRDSQGLVSQRSVHVVFSQSLTPAGGGGFNVAAAGLLAGAGLALVLAWAALRSAKGKANRRERKARGEATAAPTARKVRSQGRRPATPHDAASRGRSPRGPPAGPSRFKYQE